MSIDRGLEPLGHAAHLLRGRRDYPDATSFDRLLEMTRHQDGIGNDGLGQIGRIMPLLLHHERGFRPAGPECHIATRQRQTDGQRGTPTSGADDGDAIVHDRACCLT